MYIYIYIHIYICTCLICVYIYIYIYMSNAPRSPLARPRQAARHGVLNTHLGPDVRTTMS